MSLAAEIASSTTRKGPRCQMGIVEAALTKADLADLRAALADTSVPTAAIYRALKGRGHDVNPFGVARHRKNDCACRKAASA